MIQNSVHLCATHHTQRTDLENSTGHLFAGLYQKHIQRTSTKKCLSFFISVQDHTGYSLSTAKVEAFCALPCTKLFWKFKPEWLQLKKKCVWVERQVAFLTWRNTYSVEKVHYLPALSEVKQTAGLILNQHNTEYHLVQKWTWGGEIRGGRETRWEQH